MRFDTWHHRHVYGSLHSDFTLFEVGVWLHTLAQSLVSVFLPVLLFKTGFTLTEILLYYLIFNCIDVPLNLFVVRVVAYVGAKKTLILGTFFAALFFSFLALLTVATWWFLIILALLAALYDTFFWIAHMYLLMEVSQKKEVDVGRAVGLTDSLRRMATLLGPLVGLGLLLMLGKVFLLVVVVFIFCLSLFAFYKMQHVHIIPEGRSYSFRDLFKSSIDRKNYIGLSLWGVSNEVDSVLWPLFIFFSIGTVESIALIPVLASTASIFLAYGAGILTKRYTYRMLLLGSISIALVWLLRFFVDTVSIYYISTIAMGIFALLVVIPLDKNIVARSSHVGTLAGAFYRNFFSMSLRIPLYACLLLAGSLIHESFILAALSLSVLAFYTYWSHRTGYLKY